MNTKKTKKKSTENIIEELVKHLNPVKPRHAFLVSFTVLMGTFLSFGLIYCLSLGLWFNHIVTLLNSTAFIYTLLCFIATVCAITFVLKLSIPGKKTRLTQWLLMLLGLAILTVWFLLHTNAKPHSFFYLDPVFSCAIKIIAMTFLPSAISWHLAKKAYILNKTKTALICIISGTCLALSVIFLHCPILDGMHLLQWHFSPTLSLILLVYGLFRLVKKF